MRGLHVADVEVVVREDRAAHRTDQNGLVLNAKLVDGAGEHLVDDAVAASGAEVRLVLQLRLALDSARKRILPCRELLCIPEPVR